ncbi:MAG: hypothetical protein KDK37_08235 [Leptospiraceae bacterium]|nr:hypothetical protein [Leptospiraceae bacterium]MCB1304251.1 hypothetical protein [Leptospiraceae bacterium]
MLKPLDMQVAFHALPEYARTQSEEIGATAYKQVQDLGRARDETIQAASRVMQNQAPLESQNPAVRRDEARQTSSARSRSQKRELDNEQSTVYENLGWGGKTTPRYAGLIDQIA